MKVYTLLKRQLKWIITCRKFIYAIIIGYTGELNNNKNKSTADAVLSSGFRLLLFVLFVKDGTLNQSHATLVRLKYFLVYSNITRVGNH